MLVKSDVEDAGAVAVEPVDGLEGVDVPYYQGAIGGASDHYFGVVLETEYGSFMVIMRDVVNARPKRAGGDWVDGKVVLFSESERIINYSFSAVSIAGARYADNF